MSLDYLRNIKPLEDAGLSDDAAIAEAIVNSRLTHRDIPITAAGNEQGGSILFLLTAQFPVMSMGSDQTWLGPLIDLRTASEEVDAAMGVLMPYLQVQGSKVSSSTMTLSARALYAITEAVKSIVPALPPELGLSPEQVDDAVNAITGGRLFDSVTASDVATARTDYQTRIADEAAQQAVIDAVIALEEEYTRLYNENIAPLIGDQNTSTADWKAALQAMTDSFGS